MRGKHLPGWISIFSSQPSFLRPKASYHMHFVITFSGENVPLCAGKVGTKVFAFVFSRTLSLFASKYDEKSVENDGKFIQSENRWLHIFFFPLSQTINKISIIFAIFLLKKQTFLRKANTKTFRCNSNYRQGEDNGVGPAANGIQGISQGTVALK
jgi:hypothetical protein